MSRSTGVDVVTGEGLSEALAGVDTIVDAASWPTNEQEPATEGFIAAARNLQEEGERAGVQRIVVVVSIIGADRVTSGYIASKIPHEEAMKSGTIPVRILRAAQFHEFVPLFLERGRQGEMLLIDVPEMRTQLVAARPVAEALAESANGSAPAAADCGHHDPGDRRPAGGEPRRCGGGLVAARRGDSVRIEAVSDPDDPEQAVWASGALLPGPDAVLAVPTLEQWLYSTTRDSLVMAEN